MRAADQAQAAGSPLATGRRIGKQAEKEPDNRQTFWRLEGGLTRAGSSPAGGEFYSSFYPTPAMLHPRSTAKSVQACFMANRSAEVEHAGGPRLRSPRHPLRVAGGIPKRRGGGRAMPLARFARVRRSSHPSSPASRECPANTPLAHPHQSQWERSWHTADRLPAVCIRKSSSPLPLPHRSSWT